MARGRKKEVQQPSSEDESETSSSSAHQDDESDSNDEEEMNNANPTGSASKDDESIIVEDSSDEDDPNVNTAPPPISKSWAALTTHSPCYTGGNVLFSSSGGLSNSNKDERHLQPHFILAQRGGDVSIIEASTGLLLRTLRRGAAYQGSGDDMNAEEDDDEEVMDAEAITAFDLVPNNKEVIVVTRGHLVRRYSLVHSEDGNDQRKKKEHSDVAVTALTNAAPIISTLGKSGHSLPVTKIAHHPSGIFFATGSVDGLVKIWDSRNGYATHAFLPTSGGKGRYAVTCLQWKQVATSLILAIGREDGSISIHDLMLSQDKKANNLPLVVLRDHVSAVTCVTWAENGGGKVDSSKKHGGGLFFSSGRDSVINTWLISEEDAAPPRKKKKSQDGGTAKTISTKVSYTRIRTLPVYEQVESLILLSRRYRPASESKGQQEILDRKDIVLATVGTKGNVRLWKAKPTGGEGVHSISDLSLLASQNEMDAFGEDKGGYTSLHLTNLSTTQLSPLLVAVDAEHNMTFLKMSWGQNQSGGEVLQIKTDRSIVGDNGEILDMAVIPGSSNDRHTIAVATNSAQIRIFGLADANKDEIGNDEATGNPTHSALSPRGLLDGHTAIVLAINASPCGRYLATASKDKTMRVWHLASRKCIGLATGHTEAVGSVALSNKAGCYDVGGKSAESGAGAFVVTASKDRTLKVWPLPGSAVLNKSAANGEELQLRARLSARAHEKDINIVSVAPNDSLIATGSQDKTVKLWRPTDLALHATLKGHKRGIWDCQFSKTDRVLATSSGDKTIKLWSIADSSCVRTFQVRKSIKFAQFE
jgi:U3 small nucleolar RNA-associated protein 13